MRRCTKPAFVEIAMFHAWSLCQIIVVYWCYIQQLVLVNDKTGFSRTLWQFLKFSGLFYMDTLLYR